MGKLKVTKCDIEGLAIIEPEVHRDNRLKSQIPRQRRLPQGDSIRSQQSVLLHI